MPVRLACCAESPGRCSSRALSVRLLWREMHFPPGVAVGCDYFISGRENRTSLLRSLAVIGREFNQWPMSYWAPNYRPCQRFVMISYKCVYGSSLSCVRGEYFNLVIHQHTRRVIRCANISKQNQTHLNELVQVSPYENLFNALGC